MACNMLKFAIYWRYIALEVNRVEFTRQDTKIFKGIAILLMLYHHLFAFPERVLDGQFVSLWYFNDTNLSVCLGAFGCICLPIFTFLSGYGLYRSSLRGESSAALAARHIKSLYKTYWMVFFVCLPVVVYKTLFYRRSLIMYDIVYNFLGLSFSFNSEWWFVLPFTVLLVLFPAIKRFAERPNAGLYIDLFLVIILNAVIVYIVPYVMELNVFTGFSSTVFWARTKEVLEILPAFLTGVIFARWDVLSRIKERLGGRALWCAAAIAGMCAVFIIRAHSSKYFNFIPAVAFLMCVTVLLPTKLMMLAGRVLEKLGEESAIMWLVHTFFCYYWLQRLVYAPKYSPLIFLWLVALSYGSAKLIRLLWKWLGTMCLRLSRPRSEV